MKMMTLISVGQRYLKRWRFLFFLCLGLLVWVAPTLVAPVNGESLEDYLPIAQSHPLPLSLEQVITDDGEGDYFSEIQPSGLGYLLWSDFPVTVYRSAIDENSSVNQRQRQQAWSDSVDQAIADWSKYLPLQETSEPDNADILVQREAPPPQISVNPDTGQREFSFWRNGETRYRFYLDDDRRIRHQMTILLSPHQSNVATLTTARHELGHAVGLWGHSSDAKDMLYPSQIDTTKKITVRDINTLKKLYKQPTKIGWKLLPMEP